MYFLFDFILVYYPYGYCLLGTGVEGGGVGGSLLQNLQICLTDKIH